MRITHKASQNSVRISSPTNWKKGQLLVADIVSFYLHALIESHLTGRPCVLKNHIPEGCGTWPALWSIVCTLLSASDYDGLY